MVFKVGSLAGWIAWVAASGAVWLAACSSSDRTGDVASAGASGALSNAGSSALGGAGGASNGGPFSCGIARASCNSWTTFSQATTTSWGTGTFTGGVTTFGAKLKRDTATNAIHVTGTVDDYGYGFGLFFLNCSDLSAYTGVSFKLSGTTNTANTMIFQVQTNTDYPWEAKPTDKKGACTAADKSNPFGSCVAPSKTIPVAAGSVLWSDLVDGMPVATASANEALGLQWAFPYDGTNSYSFDVTVSDVQLLGGDVTSCGGPTGAGGAGGSASSGDAGAGGA